tara:strand:- start:2 stop:568 length:567 start_codon:yes stop_codon:yes gene_type:complete
VVKIFDEFFKQRRDYFSKKPIDFDLKFKEALKSVKNELDEHLEALNANTSEIQTSYGCMNEINDKLEKLAERVEAIEIFLQQHDNFNAIEKSFEVQPLTKTEQHVFLVIYALEDEKGLVSHVDVCRKTGLPSYVVSEYIARLVEKGVPLMKKYINNIPYIRLNPEFKRVQAKENILCIDTAQKELVNF